MQANLPHSCKRFLAAWSVVVYRLSAQDGREKRKAHRAVKRATRVTYESELDLIPYDLICGQSRISASGERGRVDCHPLGKT
jgi:hypothetical protein